MTLDKHHLIMGDPSTPLAERGAMEGEQVCGLYRGPARPAFANLDGDELPSIITGNAGGRMTTSID